MKSTLTGRGITQSGKVMLTGGKTGKERIQRSLKWFVVCVDDSKLGKAFDQVRASHQVGTWKFSQI